MKRFADLNEQIAEQIGQKLRSSPGVSDILIPQDLDYPGLELNINREQASQLGLTPKNVVDNVITALTSNGVIAPSSIFTGGTSPSPNAAWRSYSAAVVVPMIATR